MFRTQYFSIVLRVHRMGHSLVFLYGIRSRIFFTTVFTFEVYAAKFEMFSETRSFVISTSAFGTSECF